VTPRSFARASGGCRRCWPARPCRGRRVP
jgi:hypothetical protein